MKTLKRLLCRDIKRERARLGGDWAIATVIHSRRLRDFVRWLLLHRSPIIRFEINSDFTVLRLFKDRFNNSHLFVRRELGPELEMAVVEMSLEQQVETTSSSIQD